MPFAQSHRAGKFPDRLPVQRSRGNVVDNLLRQSWHGIKWCLASAQLWTATTTGAEPCGVGLGARSEESAMLRPREARRTHRATIDAR